MEADRKKQKKKSANELIDFPGIKDDVTGTRPATPHQASEQSEFVTSEKKKKDTKVSGKDNKSS